MRIKQTDDLSLRQEIRAKLKANQGYCPCKLIKNADTKCMCKEFLNGPLGTCHCGLYIKI